ncbi:MAG: hypothetical protein AB1810_03980 [Pseudomonadota bacterium]
MIKEYKEGDVVLARYISSGGAWGEGLNFFSNENDYVQVGTWGYNQGKELLAHAHNNAPRSVLWTQEVLYVRAGKILAEIYNSRAIKIAEFVASEGDVVILLAGGHGYKILEDGTQVLEVKNGPYLGADVDRVRL